MNPHDGEIRRLRMAGVPIMGIVAATGLARETVRRRLMALGVPQFRVGLWPERDNLALLALLSDGCSQAEIAARLGRSIASVRGRIRKVGKSCAEKRDRSAPCLPPDRYPTGNDAEHVRRVLAARPGGFPSLVRVEVWRAALAASRRAA